MGDLKPLGSEKLQGMDKIKRILEIAKYNETPKQNINELNTTNYTIQLADGLTYGIVKEKLGYIIKKGLNESTLDYADQMRQRKYFRSYSEAMKKLNLTAAELNRVYENEEGISLIGEQAGQKKKFVLKLPKGGNKTPDVGSDPMPAPPPAEPTPPSDPATPPPMDTTSPEGDMGGSPTDTGMGGEPTDTGMGVSPTDTGMGGAPTDTGMGGAPTDTGMGGSPEGDMGGEESAPSDDDFDLGGEEGEQKAPSFKSVQRLTGKLSQKLRSIEKEKNLESDDIKYVLNSIISALNLDNLEEDDRDDILSKFDEEEVDYGAEGEGELDMSSSEEDFNMGGDNMNDMGASQPPMETEPNESYPIYGESRVEKILSSYFDIKPSENPILEEKRKKEYIKNKIKKLNIKKEVRELSESISQMEEGFKLLEENAKFVGKTNKENLIFIKNGKQIKVTQRGQVL
jgi:hypothetical protein